MVSNEIKRMVKYDYSIFSNAIDFWKRKHGKAGRCSYCCIWYWRRRGYTVEALARSGVGTIDLIDDDKESMKLFL